MRIRWAAARSYRAPRQVLRVSRAEHTGSAGELKDRPSSVYHNVARRISRSSDTSAGRMFVAIVVKIHNQHKHYRPQSASQCLGRSLKRWSASCKHERYERVATTCNDTRI